MIRIKINGKVKAEVPDNTNKEKFLVVLSLYLFNQEIQWDLIELERVME